MPCVVPEILQEHQSFLQPLWRMLVLKYIMSSINIKSKYQVSLSFTMTYSLSVWSQILFTEYFYLFHSKM